MFAVKITEENIEELSNWLKTRPDIDNEYLHKLTIGEYVTSGPRHDYSYQIWNTTLYGYSNIKEVSMSEFRKEANMIESMTSERAYPKPIKVEVPQVKSNIQFNGFGGL